MRRHHLSGRLADIAVLGLLALTYLVSPADAADGGASDDHSSFCGYRTPEQCRTALASAVGANEIPYHLSRQLPTIPPAQSRSIPDPDQGLTAADLFLYPDHSGVLTSNFSDGALFAFLAQAANSLLSQYGDSYDFVGFFTSFTPHHRLGSAFYLPVKNSVLGIGDPLLGGGAVFDLHRVLGVAGFNLQGLLMMWDVDAPYWATGTGPDANFSRLAIAHEYEHRFGVYLPQLPDGRHLQGDNGSCGRAGHWNWRVDAQGSAMELSEWVGSDPAVLERSFVNFNGDIPGGVFSYLDLYLMGYATPEEMDKGLSELRYMDKASCGALERYTGPVSSFGSDDIISVAGPRYPDRFGATHHFRTAWIMVHLPERQPTEAQIDKALGMLEQQSRDWNTSTLGRGTMDHRLGRPVSTVAHGEPSPGELRVYGGDNSTVFGYTVQATIAVALVVHDAAGRPVTELVRGVQKPGNYIVSWDGGPDSMAPVEAGSYFLRLEIGPEVSTSPIVLVD